MKKLILILGAFLCVSLILVSCGNEDDKKKEKVVDTPESDAKKKEKVVDTPEADGKKLAADCLCELAVLMKEMKDNPDDADKLKEELEKLTEKCNKMEEEMLEKYKDEESDEYKEFEASFMKEIENCE
tara:strand:+ start:35 stop:418 length:384 start_codon:yes stop_codon:yes gene_type:complete